MASSRLRADQLLRSALAIGTVLFSLLLVRGALAQTTVTRDANFSWDDKKGQLYLDMQFRDIIDADMENKLSRGFPTNIVFTATVYRVGAPLAPLSTAAQSCKVTWDVWEEVYIVERARSGAVRSVEPVTTVAGVLRRCAEVGKLLAGDRSQVPRNVPLFAVGKIQVNPVSQDVLNQIQRWVMRPNGTGTVAAGDALFSTFTGLFLQRIGAADRELQFTTRQSVPKLLPQEGK